MKEMLEKYWLMPKEELKSLISDSLTQMFISTLVIAGGILVGSVVVLLIIKYIEKRINN